MLDPGVFVLTYAWQHCAILQQRQRRFDVLANLQERVGTVEKQKADLMLQQAYFQQQVGGAGPSVIPQMPQQQQQQQQSHMQPAYGVAPGQPHSVKYSIARLALIVAFVPPQSATVRLDSPP